MPRDIKRIRPLLNRLAAAWETYPDLRLGQLLDYCAVEVGRDIFYIEDEELIKETEEFCKKGNK